MEIRVDTYIETLDGTRYPVNRAYLTLVAIDADGNQSPVPGLIVEQSENRQNGKPGKNVRNLGLNAAEKVSDLIISVTALL